jgi:hypothetical protein
VPDTEPISWRSIAYETPVFSSDDQPMGTVTEVLGSDAEDIFHGLRVTLAGDHRDVMVPADYVTSLSAAAIRTELARSEIEALPTYSEEASYHLASVGRFRKHPGWKDDSKSDEEPG